MPPPAKYVTAVNIGASKSHSIYSCNEAKCKFEQNAESRNDNTDRCNMFVREINKLSRII